MPSEDPLSFAALLQQKIFLLRDYSSIHQTFTGTHYTLGIVSATEDAGKKRNSPLKKEQKTLYVSWREKDAEITRAS